METARSENAIPFDVEGAELGHRVEGGEERVSFDAFIRKYRLNDKALLDLAEIVRTADAKVSSRSRPEAAGLKAVATGFRLNAKDDHDNMRLQFPVYDALYAYCERRVEEEAEHGR